MKLCEDWTGDISAGIDNELSGQEQAQLEKHLESCGDCRALYNQLRDVHEAFPLPDEKPPDMLTPGILYKTTVETHETPWRKRIATLLSIAACVALLLWIGQANDFPSSLKDDKNSAPSASAVVQPFDENNTPSAETSDTNASSRSSYASNGEITARFITEPNLSGQAVRYIVMVDDILGFQNGEPVLTAENGQRELDAFCLISLEEFEQRVSGQILLMQNDAIIIDSGSNDVLLLS